MLSSKNPTASEQRPQDILSPKRAPHIHGKPTSEQPVSPQNKLPQWPTQDMTEADLSTLSEAILGEMDTIDQKIKQLENYIQQQGKFKAPALSSTQRAFQRGPLCCGGIHAEQDLLDAEKELSPQERLYLLEQGKQAKQKRIDEIERIREEREEQERLAAEKRRLEEERLREE